ncbi:hypothetical protein COLO4_11395 [Corchorus olitorius]|uniref:Uncharacterized protein n=1 Tax=Corchorus olitorius TaxID=93759 RepID=A0A1R3K4M7_9ROSI|nr:hypothetical protein COLO4_11395 [Corchorus olitorius]
MWKVRRIPVKFPDPRYGAVKFPRYRFPVAVKWTTITHNHPL